MLKQRSFRVFHCFFSLIFLGLLLCPNIFGQELTPTTTPGGTPSVSTQMLETTLIIRETPENLVKIEQIIKSLDVPPKQVIIEAHIFDITLDHNNSTGIDWSTFLTQAGRALPLIQYDHTTGLSGGNGTLRIGTLNNEHFSFLLKGLQGDKRAKSLSNPKITGTNGLPALISVGQRIPYYTTTTYPANGGNPPYTVRTTQFADVPISLTVTPYIYENGLIRMKVVPQITAVVSLIPDSAPWTETRQANTDVTVKNGETLILGGLITESKSDSADTVPLFGKLPLLRKLFSKSEKSAKRSELVVFITPNIIESSPSNVRGKSFSRKKRRSPNE
ncbi:MAG: type II secretion system protein GspD [Candidatus Riflebacteria bacterium]|nr:type II secretion system protein GspD [Candidatus Riflebacteria bacterium]